MESSKSLTNKEGIMFPETSLESLQVYDFLWKETLDENHINPDTVCQMCYEPVDQIDADYCNECLREI